MGAIIGSIRALAIILPCAGTGFVATSGRSPDSYPNPELGPVLGKKIEAYIVPVRASQHNILIKKTMASDQAVLRTAEIWLEGYRRHHLMPLPSVGTCDTTRDGVKGQILNSRNLVISNLIRVGDEALQENKPEVAKNRFLMAIEMTQIARESDLNALAASLSYENSAWLRLSHLDKRSQPTFTHIDRKRFEQLLSREFRNLLNQTGRTRQDQLRMKEALVRALSPDGSFAEILTTNDYELSLLLAAARRIESLIQNRSQLAAKLVAVNNGF
ncbi:MAG: hypothetical protein JNK63_03365 [Chthonomonas sp.]|nr:hypothetical protein [Chthonomonas sp.]